MSDIGVNKSGFIDKDISLGKEVGKFKTEKEAKIAAGKNTGSELVYQSKYDNHWHVDELKQDETDNISKADKTEIELNKSKMDVLGAMQYSISFVEDNSLMVEGSDPNTAKERLSYLAENGDRDTKLAVAANPSSPASAFQDLVESRDKEMAETMINNPSCPSSVLKILADRNTRFYSKDDNVFVQIGKTYGDLFSGNFNPHTDKIAKNTHTPPDVLDYIAKYPHTLTDETQTLIAKNPSTSPATLEFLASQNDDDIKEAVAANPKTPLRVLQLLAIDGNSDIRQAILDNPATPAKLKSEIKTIK